MKKELILRTFAFLLYLAISSVGQAAETTFDFSTANDRSSVKSGSITKDYVTVASTDATTSKDGFLNLTGSYPLIVSSSTTGITRIVITYTETGSNRVGGNPSVTSGTYELATTVGTWSGEAQQSVSINYTNKARILSIVVTTADAVDNGAPALTSNDGAELLAGTSTISMTTTKAGATIYYKWLRSDQAAPSVSSASELTEANGWASGTSAKAPTVSTDASYSLYAIAVGTDNSLSSMSSQTFSIIAKPNIATPVIDPNGSSAWDGNEVIGIRLTSASPGVTFYYKWGERAETADELLNDETKGISTSGIINLTSYNAIRVLSVIAVRNYGGTLYTSDVATATWNYLIPITLTPTATATTIEPNGTTTVSATAVETATSTTVSGLTYTYFIKSSSSDGATINSSTGELTAGSTSGTIVVSIKSAATDKYDGASTEITITVGTGEASLTPVSDKTWDFTTGDITISPNTSKQIDNNLEYINGAYVNKNVLYFPGGGSTISKAVHFKVAGNSRIKVVIAEGTAGRTLAISNGTSELYTGNVSATEDITITTSKFNTQSDVYLYSKGSGISVKSIIVEPVSSSTKSDVILSALDKTVIVGSAVEPEITATSNGTQISNLTYTYTVISGSNYVDGINADGTLTNNKITGKAAGTATIRVSFEGNNDYNAISTTFNVTVEETTGTSEGYFDISKLTYSNGIVSGSAEAPSDANLTVSISGSSNNESGSNSLKFAKGTKGVLTFKAPDGYSFSGITINWDNTNRGTVSSTSPVAATDEKSLSADPYVWTGNSSNVTINVAAAAGNDAVITGITFNYTKDDGSLNVPTFSPVAGTVYGSQNVAITNVQSGVHYYYRIDNGTEAYKNWSPGSTEWNVYDGVINITAPDDNTASRTVTLSVAAVSNSNATAYASATYTVTLHDAPVIKFNKSTGITYYGQQSLGISTDIDDDDVYIYYHIAANGESAPTADDADKWTRYTEPLTITDNGTTVYAFADGDAYKTSAVGSVTITIAGDKTTPGLAWSPSGKQTVKYEDKDTFTPPVLTNGNNVRVAYSSTEPKVAVVDESGKLSIVGIGTTDITATYTGTPSSAFSSQSVTYTLEVTTDKERGLSFYSHSLDNILADNQEVPSGIVVKLDIQNYPVNYITMVSLNGSAAYPKKANRNEDNNFYYHGRGIPLYSTDAGTDGKVAIQVKLFDPSASDPTKAVAEYIKTLIVKPYDGQPAIPTAAPATTADQQGVKTIMTLSESSTVTGDVGNIVYAKYSNSLTYLPRILLAEPNISIDTTKTGVFSTLVSEARRTTAIQVKPDVVWNDGRSYDIASDRMTVYYEYTPNRHSTRIEASPSPIRRDMKEVRGYTDENGTVIAANPDVQLSLDFYVDDNSTDISTLSSKGIAYTFESSNAAVATVNANGKVTVTGPGTATIKISTPQVNGSAKPVDQKGTKGYDAAVKTISVVITDIENARLLPPTFNPPTNAVYHVAFDAQVIANAKNDEKPKTVGDAYYILTDDQTKAYTAEEIQAYGTKVSVGSSKKVNIPANPADDGKMYTIWAVTYNPENDNATQPHYSDITSVTFTYKYITVDAPVLKPGNEGEKAIYNFTSDKLTVVASVATPGASVYYTVDKPGDNVDINNGTLYDGSVKIVLSQSAVIRAVAYLDGVYSDIVTYRYRKVATPLDRPPFTVGSGSFQYDKGNGLEATMDKKAIVKIYALPDNDGDGLFSDETPVDVLNPTDNAIGYTIYYTTDGTLPAVATSTKYTQPLDIEQSLTIRAIAVAPDGSTSLASTLKLTITNGISVWLADDNTCIATPDGTNYTGQLKDQIISKDVENANTATAPRYITITIGDTHDRKTRWGHQTVNEIFQGHRIDGYGSYDIIAKSGVSTDVYDEDKVLYNHSYAQLPEGTTPAESVKSKAGHVYESTYKLPAHGTFVRFEPQRDGTIYIWCLQNGGLHYSKSVNNEDRFYSQFIRKRPAYLIDEQGHSIEASSITASGTFDYSNWKKIDRTKLLGLGGNQDGLSQDLFTQEEAQDIYDMYNAEIMKNNIADNTFNLTSLVAKLNDGNHGKAAGAGVDVNGDNVVDNTGYSLPSASYMKYAFPVKAGKTYFFFALKTKVGISALGFKADDDAETVSNETLTLDQNADDNASKINSILNDNTKRNATYDVTVKHTFAKGVWSSIVLPFSVSETQMKSILGDNVDVVHFTRWDPTEHIIYLTRHFYNKMIVAGTPVFIKPDKDISEMTFTGVHIEANAYDVVDDSLKVVRMTGNYDKGMYLKQFDYYLNKGGEISQRTKPGTISGMRGWLTGLSEQAKAKTALGFVYDEGAGVVTGIIKVADDNGTITGRELDNDCIYNMSGQIVSRDPSKLMALPEGVYILNGKKFVVK